MGQSSTSIAYEDASNDVQQIYKDIMQVLDIVDVNQIPNWATFLGAHFEKLQSKWQLIKSCIFENSLSPILREFLMVCISRSTKSPYCEARHSYEILKTTNLSYGEIVNVIDGHSHAVMPERFLVAIKIANAILNSNCTKSQKYFGDLLDAGFSEVEAIEIIELLSAGTYISFYAKCLNLPIDTEIESYLNDHNIHID